MGLRDIPSDRRALASFVSQYESTHMVYAQSNREIADATIAVMEAWLPRLLRPVVRPAISCLVSEKLLAAFDYPRPSAFLRVVVRVVLALRAAAKRYINFERSPALLAGCIVYKIWTDDSIHHTGFIADILFDSAPTFIRVYTEDAN